MSKSFDAAAANRQKLIHNAVLEDNNLLGRMLYRAGVVLRGVQQGLIDISNSPKKLAMSLLAGAAIGFAAASGAFTMKSADLELASMQEQVHSVSAAGQQDSNFDKEVGSLLNKAQTMVSNVDKSLSKNSALAKKCMSGDQGKECTKVREQLGQAAQMINASETLIDGYMNTGGQVSDKMLMKSEEVRAKLKDVNEKFPNLFTKENKAKFHKGAEMEM